MIHSYEQLLEAVSLLPEGVPPLKKVVRIEVDSLSLPTPTRSTLGGTFTFVGPETISFAATPRGWRASLLVQFDDFEIVPELKGNMERALSAAVTLGAFEGTVTRVVVIVPYKDDLTSTVETAPSSPPSVATSRKRMPTGGLNNVDLGAFGRSIKDDIRQRTRHLDPIGEMSRSLADAGRKLDPIGEATRALSAAGDRTSGVYDAIRKVQGIADATSKLQGFTKSIDTIMGPIGKSLAMHDSIVGPAKKLTALADQLTASQRWADQMLPARSADVDLVRMAEKALAVSKPIEAALAAVESLKLPSFTTDIDVTAGSAMEAAMSKARLATGGAAIEAVTSMAKLARPAILDAMEASATMQAIAAVARPTSAAEEAFKIVSAFDDMTDPFREMRDTRDALRSPLTQLRDDIAALHQHPLKELQESLHEAISPKALRDAISPKALRDAISPAHPRRRLSASKLAALESTKQKRATAKKTATKQKPTT